MAAPRLHHAATELPTVTVDSYNVELRSGGGFLGDRGSNRAFRSILDNWREQVAPNGEGGDPLGDVATRGLSKRKLDELLLQGEPEAAGLILGAIEEFANEIAKIAQRFTRTKDWKGTQRIVVGGGFRNSRLGELAIGRASILARGLGLDLNVVPIRHHPDEAGLIGAAHLMPAWMWKGHDSLAAVDIGGTNIRAGIIQIDPKSGDLAGAKVWRSTLWRHRKGEKTEVTRDEAVAKLSRMIKKLAERAEKDGLRMAPFIGVGCPGLIDDDGTILRGGQNLPGGDWEGTRFNLPSALGDDIPKIAGEPPVVLMHNDAVVQGLSQIPFLDDLDRWAVFTIGTGLGNARFTSRKDDSESRS